MYKQKIGISLDHKYSIEICEILKIIKNVGFEAISPAWKSNADLVQIANTAKELGLEVQSLHAPFGKAADMWSREADIYTPVKMSFWKS